MLSRERTSAPTFGSLWRDMMRLQDELNSAMFRSPALSTPTGFPAFNLWSGEESALVTAELPGVLLDDLDISVVGDTLTIRGSRLPDAPGQESTYHRRERASGHFSRTIQLPFRVEADQVEANLANGVLKVTLPQAMADRPRKIQIQSA
jgi:HSP20 family protein